MFKYREHVWRLFSYRSITSCTESEVLWWQLVQCSSEGAARWHRASDTKRSCKTFKNVAKRSRKSCQIMRKLNEVALNLTLNNQANRTRTINPSTPPPPSPLLQHWTSLEYANACSALLSYQHDDVDEWDEISQMCTHLITPRLIRQHGTYKVNTDRNRLL